MDTIKHMLSVLKIEPNAQRVYFDLLISGMSTARQIATRIGVPRSSLYDYLRPLLDRGLVVEKDIEGKGHFLVHDLSELDRQVAELSDTIALHRQQFAKIKTTLKVDITAEPKIKFVSGKAGVESLLKEMLWDAEETIYTVWPYHEMLQVFTAETLELFNRRRIKQNIALKSIWTGGKIPARHLWQGADFKVERRLAPKKYYSPMAYSVYGDRVSFISSERELYGFTVHSKEFAALMLCQFSALWSIAKE